MPISGPETNGGPPTSLTERSFKTIKQYGDKLFLIDDKNKTKHTYIDLWRRCASIAVKLKKLGVGNGKVVALISENSIEAFSFQYAVWYAGGISNPMNFNMKKDEIRTLMTVSQPMVVFCDNKYIELALMAADDIGWEMIFVTLKPRSPFLCYDDFLNEDVTGFDVRIADPSNHINVALFTSGTTGIPKAVKLRDCAPTAWESALHWKDDHCIWLLSSPMFWISNYMVSAKSILSGKLIILPEATDAKSFLKCITQFKPHVFFTGSSVLLDMCLLTNLHEYDTSSVKRVMIGGSKTPLEQKHLIRKKLFGDRNVLENVYGSTEVSGLVTSSEGVKTDSPEYDSVGCLVPGVVLKVVDVGSGRELGPMEEGEFCVKASTFMAGYMNKDYVNVDLDSSGWWHMGDIGYYDKNGYVYYTNRLKDIMKYRGTQISPAELESVILKHPEVLEACVVGKPHPIDGEWPTAFVIKKPGSKLTEKFLDIAVTECVGEVKKLRGGIHFVTELPRSSVGKILKRELVKQLTEIS